MSISPLFAVCLGAATISFAPIFAGISPLGPTLTPFYRCFLAGVLVLAWNPRLPQLNKQTIKMLLPGLFFAVDLFLWHKSIKLAGAGLSTVLANTQVLFVMFIAHWYLGEILPRRQWLYTGLAMIGVFLISYSAWNQDSMDLSFLSGVILGVISGLSYAFYLLSFRSLKPASWPDAVSNLGWVSLSAGVFLGLLLFLEGASWKLPQGFAVWWPILGLVLICQILGWLLISWGSAKMPATKASMILLLQPVLASVLSFVWLEERWNQWQSLGASLTLLAIYLCLRNRNSQKNVLN